MGSAKAQKYPDISTSLFVSDNKLLGIRILENKEEKSIVLPKVKCWKSCRDHALKNHCRQNNIIFLFNEAAELNLKCDKKFLISYNKN